MQAILAIIYLKFSTAKLAKMTHSISKAHYLYNVFLEQEGKFDYEELLGEDKN